jgi:hypothetical protein
MSVLRKASKSRWAVLMGTLAVVVKPVAGG